MENLRDNGINNTRYCDCLTSNFLILARKIKFMEKKYNEQFSVVFEAIYKLMETPEKKKRKIGFKREKD